MKVRRTEDSDATSNITASKLVAIKASQVFDRNITLAAAVKYRLGGRRKVRKPEEYNVELCIVLVKSKVKVWQIVPAQSIVCNSGGGDTSIGTSISRIGG